MIAIPLIAGIILGTSVALWAWHRIRARKQLEQHSITVEELHTLLDTRKDVLLFDVRLPLDMLTDAEIIPGAQQI